MLARYFMYSQLYFHPIRRIYNVHLVDFLRAWLPNGKFDTSVDAHLTLTDNEVTAGIFSSARDTKHPAHDSARRIALRDHFRLVYERNPDDVKINPQAGRAVSEFLSRELGAPFIRHEYQSPKGGALDFPVKMHDGRSASSTSASETLSKIPPPTVDFVYADRAVAEKARSLIGEKRNEILSMKEH